MYEQSEQRLAALADKLIDGSINAKEEREFTSLYKQLREQQELSL